MTKKRAAILKKIAQQNGAAPILGIPGTSWSDLKFTTASSSADEIVFPLLTRVCRDLLTQKEEVLRTMEAAYRQILVEFETRFYSDLEDLATLAGKIDVDFTKAFLAMDYDYCRPTIVNDIGSDGPSFVDAAGLRHALIERLSTRDIYVANDIDLGVGLNKSPTGILLYGTNAVGKTSLIRALGIAVIMAQAGFYVPCAQFRYKPYTAIFSRILGNDNLFKGLSTFAVEMTELRVILKMADCNSLILGDELCSGTETESALSIFVAGLMDLYLKRASFIFATHFHEIVRYEEIRAMTGLALKHMAVFYDRETDALVYDRRLKEGAGNRMYGLEVCKSLHLPDEFLDRAFEIRRKYFPETRGELSHPCSRYNAEKIRGKCEVCFEELGSETHHILPQKVADLATGKIRTGGGAQIHKNDLVNLMSVCDACHTRIHYS
jgi:DNA mismatch repair protein MutS